MKITKCKFCKGTKFTGKKVLVCSKCKAKVQEDNSYGSHLIWTSGQNLGASCGVVG